MTAERKAANPGRASSEAARAVFVLPVKRFANAKQRLKDRLGEGARSALAAAMFSDVLSAVGRATTLETLLIVSGERAVRDIAAGSGAVLLDDADEKGQSRAALAGLARAAALGSSRAVLVAADCPLAKPSELDELVRGSVARDLDVVIVPDRHGEGTNALVVDPAGPFKPEFGPGSLRRHVEQAERRGLRHSVAKVASLALDVDTADDLAELTLALDRGGHTAPRTEGVLRQIERSSVAAA